MCCIRHRAVTLISHEFIGMNLETNEYCLQLVTGLKELLQGVTKLSAHLFFAISVRIVSFLTLEARILDECVPLVSALASAVT